VARLIEPETARTVHVREIDECKPAFGHALPLGELRRPI
jgi:hypothetical protein